VGGCRATAAAPLEREQQAQPRPGALLVRSENLTHGVFDRRVPALEQQLPPALLDAQEQVALGRLRLQALAIERLEGVSRAPR
jgi:hypothetical protein